MIERIDDRLANLAALEGVIRLRPCEQAPALRSARRRAAAWWGRLGPLLAMQL